MEHPNALGYIYTIPYIDLLSKARKNLVDIFLIIFLY